MVGYRELCVATSGGGVCGGATQSAQTSSSRKNETIPKSTAQVPPPLPPLGERAAIPSRLTNHYFIDFAYQKTAWCLVEYLTMISRVYNLLTFAPPPHPQLATTVCLCGLGEQ